MVIFHAEWTEQHKLVLLILQTTTGGQGEHQMTIETPIAIVDVLSNEKWVVRLLDCQVFDKKADRMII
jgi:hypothetical protein